MPLLALYRVASEPQKQHFLPREVVWRYGLAVEHSTLTAPGQTEFTTTALSCMLPQIRSCWT